MADNTCGIFSSFVPCRGWGGGGRPEVFIITVIIISGNLYKNPLHVMNTFLEFI